MPAKKADSAKTAKATTRKKTTKKAAGAKKSTKKTVTKKVTRNSAASAVPPTYDEIAARAFMVWERKGRPEGQDMHNWRQAEAELLAERGLSA